MPEAGFTRNTVEFRSIAWTMVGSSVPVESDLGRWFLYRSGWQLTNQARSHRREDTLKDRVVNKAASWQRERRRRAMSLSCMKRM